MYLTFYTTAKPQQLTWEDILNNPYISESDLGPIKPKKITKIISEEYGEQLWNKRKPNIELLFSNIDDRAKLIENTKDHYSHFEIPKKSDPRKKRPIDAPDETLASIQGAYKDIIEKTLHFTPHNAAHAYVAERSVVTAMEKHRNNNSKWYLQIDLKNFFNSITGEWMNRILPEVYPFRFIPQESLDLIIKTALLDGGLPQGSRISPTLTNVVMVPIDHDITETLHNYKRHHYVYTRYADDITISCKEKFNPEEILKIIKDIFKKWNVPFRINNEKTRFGSTAGRNYHLGLIINKNNKISAGHEKNQKFRAMLFNFCTVGDEWEPHDVQKMLGLISYYKSFEPEFVKNTIAKYNDKFDIDIMMKAKGLINQ